jgi:hypothetical protein
MFFIHILKDGTFKVKLTFYINVIKEYLQMPSTWEAIIGLISIVASLLKPVDKDLILYSGASIWAFLRLITRDTTSVFGRIIKAAVTAHDELQTNIPPNDAA